MAISINSAADARYYAARATSSRTNSSSAAKKSTSSIVSSAARAVAAATSAVKSVVKKNSSSATTTTKRNNTNAAVNAASASVKSKTNQNKKTTTTISSAASKVASSISKAVKTATNVVKTAAQNTKVSTNAKAAAVSTTKTASKNTTSSKNTTNAKTAAVNNSYTKKTTSSSNNNLASRIVNTVSTAASTVKKAASNANPSAAAERARQEAMSKAASAKAEAEAKARAAAATKSATASAAIGVATTATIKSNKNTALSNKNTGKTTNTTVNPNVVKMDSTVNKNNSNTIAIESMSVKQVTTYNNSTKSSATKNTSTTAKSEACRTSLSMALTGKHSEGLERYLNNLEKEFGTRYVFENVFKNESKYNAEERAKQICGILQTDIMSETDNTKFQTILNGKDISPYDSDKYSFDELNEMLKKTTDPIEIKKALKTLDNKTAGIYETNNINVPISKTNRPASEWYDNTTLISDVTIIGGDNKKNEAGTGTYEFSYETQEYMRSACDYVLKKAKDDGVSDKTYALMEKYLTPELIMAVGCTESSWQDSQGVGETETWTGCKGNWDTTTSRFLDNCSQLSNTFSGESASNNIKDYVGVKESILASANVLGYHMKNLNNEGICTYSMYSYTGEEDFLYKTLLCYGTGGFSSANSEQRMSAPYKLYLYDTFCEQRNVDNGLNIYVKDNGYLNLDEFVSDCKGIQNKVIDFKVIPYDEYLENRKVTLDGSF